MEDSNTTSRRSAIGTTMAAAPPLQELRDTALLMLESGQSREEVDAYLRDVAVNHPEMGLRRFLGINRKAGRLDASKLALEIGKFYSNRLKRKRVKDALADFAHANALDRWLSDYILGWIDEGEPPPVAESNVRVVHAFEMGPPDDKVTAVALLINSMADPKDAVQEFMDLCARTFPSETWSRRGMAEQDAQRVRLFAEGLTDFDIAKRELKDEGFDLRAKDKREWNREVATRANTICQSRKRWITYLTNLLEPVSPSNDNS